MNSVYRKDTVKERIINNLCWPIVFVFSLQSLWCSFLGHYNYYFDVLSIAFVILCLIIIKWRWNKSSIGSHIIYIISMLILFLTVFSLMVEYIDWFHQFEWLYGD